MKFKHVKHYEKQDLAKIAEVTVRTIFYWEENDDIPLKYYPKILPLVLSKKAIEELRKQPR